VTIIDRIKIEARLSKNRREKRWRRSIYSFGRSDARLE
jgi:hypothetical protein